VYGRTFDIFEGETYPDDESRSSVYVSPPSSPVYMEVEVTSPIVELAGSGGNYTFTENWFTAKMRTPVIDVNTGGAIAEKLSYEQSTQNLMGIYGVFYTGTAKVVFLGSERQILSQGVSHTITPLAEFQLSETIVIPEGTATAEVRVYNTGDQFVGLLDTASVSELISGITTEQPTVVSEYRLEQNYPNPFNPSTTIAYSLPKRSSVEVMIYTMQGQKIRSYTFDAQPSGRYTIDWDGTGELGNPLSSGVYMYRIRALSTDDGTLFDRSSKMILLK
jgi:hypothetical protein